MDERLSPSPSLARFAAVAAAFALVLWACPVPASPTAAALSDRLVPTTRVAPGTNPARVPTQRPAALRRASSRLRASSRPLASVPSSSSATALPLPLPLIGALTTAGVAAWLATARRPRTTALRHHTGPTDGPQATRALLLDCDGTIVDTERDGHRIAFNRAFHQMGLTGVEWGVELYGELLTTGGGKERMTRYFKDYAPTLWPDKAEAPSPKHPLITNLHELKTKLFMEIIEQGALPLRPGIRAIVDGALAAGWKVAVCSTSNEKSVQAVVDRLLESKIKHIFAGDIVSNKKPDPAIYNLAAKELGVDPAHCVVIEDSRIGVLAARAAGMACVVTKSTYTADEDFTGAQLILEDLGATHLPQLEALLL
jgi:HAD superfamily hydrolase (TIGR01509 family)